VPLQFSFQNSELLRFFSSKAIDGTSIIDSSISGDNSYLSSFYVTGYHRTQDELIKRNQNNERIAGLHLTYNAEKLKLGLTFVDGKYELLYYLNKNYIIFIVLRGIGSQSLEPIIPTLTKYSSIWRNRI